MTNKYLTKLAKTEIAAAGNGLRNAGVAPRATVKDVQKADPVGMTAVVPNMEQVTKTAGLSKAIAWAKELPTTDKVKLSLSGAGFALGAGGAIASAHKIKGDRHRENLEAQSLATLKKIHEALAKQQEIK